MSLLNIPAGLNPIEDFVLRQIPKSAKSGIIVNPGTNRLSKAIEQKLGAPVSIYNIEPRTPLYNLLDNNEFKAKDPWNSDWYTQTAKKHGNLDFIIFLNIHEYWNEDLLNFKTIINLLKPEGFGFISFYNKASLYEIQQSIPPFASGIEQLASPMNNWAKLDLASWMIYLTTIDFPPTHVWGMLQETALNYCNQATQEKTTWTIKNLNIQVRDASDAYILGAPVMCLQFQACNKEPFPAPQFVGFPYNASMLQAILFPYLNILSKKIDIFNAQLETSRYPQEEDGSLILLNFFLSQLEDFKDVKKVLVVGCNWGANLLDLKKIKPNWQITGVDASKEILDIGSPLIKQKNIEAFTYSDDGTLPFPDNSFDLVISLKHFSHIHEPLAKNLAKEMLRVTKLGIAQIEDLRGPEFSMQLKLYSIPDIYSELKHKSDVQAINIDNKDSGFYILKIKK